jgi:hypothetical protein
MKQNNPQPEKIGTAANEVDNRHRTKGNRPPGKSEKKQRLH